MEGEAPLEEIWRLMRERSMQESFPCLFLLSLVYCMSVGDANK